MSFEVEARPDAFMAIGRSHQTKSIVLSHQLKTSGRTAESGRAAFPISQLRTPNSAFPTPHSELPLSPVVKR